MWPSDSQLGAADALSGLQEHRQQGPPQQQHQQQQQYCSLAARSPRYIQMGQRKRAAEAAAAPAAAAAATAAATPGPERKRSSWAAAISDWLVWPGAKRPRPSQGLLKASGSQASGATPGDMQQQQQQLAQLLENDVLEALAERPLPGQAPAAAGAVGACAATLAAPAAQTLWPQAPDDASAASGTLQQQPAAATAQLGEEPLVAAPLAAAAAAAAAAEHAAGGDTSTAVPLLPPPWRPRPLPHATTVAQAAAGGAAGWALTEPQQHRGGELICSTPSAEPAAGSGVEAGSQVRARGGGEAFQQPAVSLSPPAAAADPGGPHPRRGGAARGNSSDGGSAAAGGQGLGGKTRSVVAATATTATTGVVSGAATVPPATPTAAAAVGQTQQPRTALQPPTAEQQQQQQQQQPAGVGPLGLPKRVGERPPAPQREKEEEEPGSVLKLPAPKSLDELKQVLQQHASTPAPRPRLEIDLEGVKYPAPLRGMSKIDISGGLKVELRNGTVDACIRVIDGAQLTMSGISVFATADSIAAFGWQHVACSAISVVGPGSKAMLRNCSVGHTRLEAISSVLGATDNGSCFYMGGPAWHHNSSVHVSGENSSVQLAGDVRIGGAGVKAENGGKLVAEPGLVVSSACHAFSALQGGTIQVGDGCEARSCANGVYAQGAGSKVQMWASFTATGCDEYKAQTGLKVESGGFLELGAACKVVHFETGVHVHGRGSCVKVGANSKVIKCRVGLECGDGGSVVGEYWGE